jgi:hypothetical protein
MGKMAKRRIQNMRYLPSIRFLLLLCLVAGLAVTATGADQQSAKMPSPAARAVPITTPKKKAVRKAVKASKTPAERKSKSPASHSDLAEGKRDPFQLPAVPSGNGNPQGVMNSAPGGALPPGVRGLLISQLRLEGVVREQAANKMIAVVTNETRRAYFLTENEAVYNGVVSKITPDAVYFKENVLDANGRLTTREVMKRLGSASGEGR